MTPDSVVLKSIPHDNHRYATAGDYFHNGTEWVIRTSDLGDWRFNCLLQIHELVELVLTQAGGVSEKAITAFDRGYYRTHPDEEPGDCPHCPYHRQHLQAEIIERALCEFLGLDWRDYEKALNALWEPNQQKPKRKSKLGRATGAVKR